MVRGLDEDLTKNILAKVRKGYSKILSNFRKIVPGS